MDLDIITKKLISEISHEINKDENIIIIKKDILTPIIKHIIEELKPFFLKVISLIIIIFVFIIITLFLNLKIILRD